MRFRMVYNNFLILKISDKNRYYKYRCRYICIGVGIRMGCRFYAGTLEEAKKLTRSVVGRCEGTGRKDQMVGVVREKREEKDWRML